MIHRIATALAAMLLTATAALAQEAYPSRQITLVVPFGPGGASDNIARVLAQRMSEVFGKTVIVDNRPGAAGNIALEHAARAPADGYTLFLGNVSTNAINAATYATTIRVNPGKELTGVAAVAEVPSVFASSEKFAPNTIAELVAYAKAHPSGVDYASAGAGSYAMIDMLMFEKAAGVKMVHVPFKAGAGQFVISMVAGDVPIAFINAGTVMPLIKAGKLKALAVTGTHRLADMPQVPTMTEAGFPSVGTNAWQGVFAPTGTPAPVLKKLHDVIQATVQRPDVKEGFARLMIQPMRSASPAEFTKFVNAESAKWAKVVKDLDVRIDQ